MCSQIRSTLYDFKQEIQFSFPDIIFLLFYLFFSWTFFSPPWISGNLAYEEAGASMPVMVFPSSQREVKCLVSEPVFYS